jgi:hypothetical protein
MVAKPYRLAETPRPSPPAIHKKEIAGAGARLGCHSPMDKDDTPA